MSRLARTGAEKHYKWWQFIEIGYALRYLEDARETSTIDVSPGDDKGVLGHLKTLLGRISSLDFYRSHRRVGHRMEALVDKLWDRISENPQAILGQNLCAQLRLIVRDLLQAVQSESQERTLFPVRPANQIEVEYLLEDPEGYFGLPKGGMLELSEDIRQDFIGAATFFAIDFPIPTITFALRGIEGLMRSFSREVIGTGEGKWVVLNDKLSKAGIGEDLFELLEELRERRNAAMHPGSRKKEEWDIEAASEVMNNCRKAVLGMTDYLNNHPPSSEGTAEGEQ
jgi:hypothetical protein